MIALYTYIHQKEYVLFFWWFLVLSQNVLRWIAEIIGLELDAVFPLEKTLAGNDNYFEQ